VYECPLLGAKPTCHANHGMSPWYRDIAGTDGSRAASSNCAGGDHHNAVVQRQFNASEPVTLVAVVVVTADIDPLRSIRGPNPAPAIVVASVEVVSAATVSEAIEAIMMVMEEGWVWERCAREGRRKCGTRHWHSGEASRAHLWSYAHWVPNHAHGMHPLHATRAMAGADPRHAKRACIPDTIADVSLHPGTIAALEKERKICLLTTSAGRSYECPWRDIFFGSAARCSQCC